MNHEIEEQLRLTLRDRAEHVDDTMDLSRAAIGRARTIKRHRTRLAVGASAAAVVAVIPLGLVAGDRLAGSNDAPVAPSVSVSPTAAPTATPTPTRTPRRQLTIELTPPPSSSSSVSTTRSAKPPAPSKVTLDLADLPRGEAPRTTYLDGRTVVTSAGRFRVPGNDIIRKAVYAAGRAFAITVPSGSGAGSTMVELAAGGASTEVPDVTDVRASADRTAVAHAVSKESSSGSPLKGAALHYRSGGTRSQLALPTAYGVRIHAVVADTVYFNTINPEREPGTLRRWTAGESTSTTIDHVRSPRFVSADGQVAGTSVDGGGDLICSGLVGLSDQAVRWRTCDHMLHDLAGDAVLVTTAPADGYADNLFAVLNAGTGKLRHEWTAWVLGIEFESDDSVLAEAEDDGKHALVRCSVSTGKCELATPLADGAGPDEPRRYSLGS